MASAGGIKALGSDYGYALLEKELADRRFRQSKSDLDTAGREEQRALRALTAEIAAWLQQHPEEDNSEV